ncbi:hypothetical protein Tco_0679848 [Tanacetum coccineum]|uniref:Uncharacterized protein n=1 Tax=Tanacetum coccineum TaxID=301880 RepID=A0ABQ4XIZ4_9ASTR
MYVIEQPLPAAPAADSEAQVLSQWNAVYDAYNEVAYLILGSMTPELHRQFENSSPYDMIKELKSMFEKQVGVERPTGTLGYMLPQDLIVGLILNGLTKYFAGFVKNYNMHNMGKTIGELHAMLIAYEKGLPKKAETPQGMWRHCEGDTSDKLLTRLYAGPLRKTSHNSKKSVGMGLEILKSEKGNTFKLHIVMSIMFEAEGLVSGDL